MLHTALLAALLIPALAVKVPGVSKDVDMLAWEKMP